MTALRHVATTLHYGALFKVSFIALIYLDLLLTLFALQHPFSELNPLMVRLLSRPGELLVAKVVTPPLIAWLVPAKLLLPSISFMLAVTVWNIGQLLTTL